MKVYTRAARCHRLIDPRTGEHEVMLRYRFALCPDQDPETVLSLLEYEAEQILRRTFGPGVEFVRLSEDATLTVSEVV